MSFDKKENIMEFFLKIFGCWTMLLDYDITQKLNHNDHNFNSMKTSLKEMSHDTGDSSYLHICWFYANSSL